MDHDLFVLVLVAFDQRNIASLDDKNRLEPPGGESITVGNYTWVSWQTGVFLSWPTCKSYRVLESFQIGGNIHSYKSINSYIFLLSMW